MISYAEATTADTEAALEAHVLSELTLAGVDTAGLSDLSAERGLVALFAFTEARAEGIRATIAATVNPDAVSGTWLDIVLKGRYQEDRIPALKTKARPYVGAAAGGGTQVIKPGDLRADAGNGIFFVNTQGGTIAAGVTGQLDFECEVAGIIGDVADLAITGFQRAPAGLTISNPAGWKTAGGRDAEKDGPYRKRCYAKWLSIGAGWTRDAFDYWVPKFAPSVTRIYVDDSNPLGSGSLKVYLANSTGPATIGELATVLAGLISRAFRPLGTVLPIVVAAPLVTITVTGTVYGPSVTKASDVGGALDGFASELPLGAIGGSVDLGLLYGIIGGGAYPLFDLPGFTGVTNVDLTLPAGDTAIAPAAVVAINHAGLVFV
jgi:hypothetical protein